ncbi:hypothetical protein KEM52_001079 [Ascosphaera acerosa]|nr:hypothetical protein KEM52_001079 [Ascosphaera acerosa]
MHVVEPARYPIAKVAKYVPATHTLAEALEFEASHGLRNIVIVQPSIFGTDNSNTVDALRELGPDRARGVVWIDPDNVDDAELARWHELGVRGLRLNFVSIESIPTPEQLAEEIRRHAQIAERFDWVIQVYIPLHLFQHLTKVVANLPVRLVVDHFGHPDLRELRQGNEEVAFDPYALPGFAELAGLLKQGNTYLKTSAPYRAQGVEGQLQCPQLDCMLRELLRVARDRLVYATDWPHTRFEGLDITPFTERVLATCHEMGATSASTWSSGKTRRRCGLPGLIRLPGMLEEAGVPRLWALYI